MSNQTLKSFQALRGKQKQRVNEWLFKEILSYCIHHQEEMDEQEKKSLTQRFCDRVRALSAQISEDDATADTLFPEKEERITSFTIAVIPRELPRWPVEGWR